MAGSCSRWDSNYHKMASLMLKIKDGELPFQSISGHLGVSENCRSDFFATRMTFFTMGKRLKTHMDSLKSEAARPLRRTAAEGSSGALLLTVKDSKRYVVKICGKRCYVNICEHEGYLSELNNFYDVAT